MPQTFVRASIFWVETHPLQHRWPRRAHQRSRAVSRGAARPLATPSMVVAQTGPRDSPRLNAGRAAITATWVNQTSRGPRRDAAGRAPPAALDHAAMGWLVPACATPPAQAHKQLHMFCEVTLPVVSRRALLWSLSRSIRRPWCASTRGRRAGRQATLPLVGRRRPTGVGENLAGSPGRSPPRGPTPLPTCTLAGWARSSRAKKEP